LEKSRHSNYTTTASLKDNAMVYVYDCCTIVVFLKKHKGLFYEIHEYISMRESLTGADPAN